MPENGDSPDENGNVAAALEDVLAICQRPYDTAQPVVCMDEQPIRLHTGVREPMPAQPGRPER